MNGKYILLTLTHLFRIKGSPISISDAVDFLSFTMRYAAPSQVRRMLSVALSHDMITRTGDHIQAEFLFDKQSLSPNMAVEITRNFNIDKSVEPLN